MSEEPSGAELGAPTGTILAGRSDGNEILAVMVVIGCSASDTVGDAEVVVISVVVSDVVVTRSAKRSELVGTKS